MNERMRSWLCAAYLLLCVFLGGSAQSAWANLALWILGVALIAWAAIGGARRNESGDRSSALYWLLVLALLLVLLQLVPLPASVWMDLPGRSAIAEGLRLLGLGLPSEPLSETPNQSVFTLFAFIPAVAAFIATDSLQPSLRTLALAIVGATIAAILLGALQVVGGSGSWAYLYPITNAGAVGFFANKNHMATLLLVSIPLAAALLASAKSGQRSTNAGRYGIGIAIFVLLVVGIALNGSIAGLALIIPVFLASASLLPGGVRFRRLILPLSVLALIGGTAVLTLSPVANDSLRAGESVSSRTTIWMTTDGAIRDSFPFGTGLGSFEQVYRHYEDPAQVTSTYVNHAHNDYLELALELGAPGVLLIVLFLAWWAVAAFRIWTSQLSTPFARAATIATAAILAHSVVDFPLRTAAIAAILGTSLAIMAQHLRGKPTINRGESRPTRHVTLG